MTWITGSKEHDHEGVTNGPGEVRGLQSPAGRCPGLSGSSGGGSWLHTPAAKGSGESLEGHHSRGQVCISDCSLGDREELHSSWWASGEFQRVCSLGFGREPRG